jgi:hypothetical protein
MIQIGFNKGHQAHLHCPVSPRKNFEKKLIKPLLQVDSRIIHPIDDFMS